MMFPTSYGRKTLPWQDNVGEFGDKFRKAREKKEMSLDDVSNVTKIGARMLRAIEEEHFDQLPGGVFNKGFIRAYAKHLGLNDEEAVSDYLSCLRQAQIDAHEVWEPEASSKQNSAQRLATEKRHLVEPKKSAVKSSSAVEVQELPNLQLPRAEDVRPPRKSFAKNSDREMPWSILTIAAVVLILAGILWVRRSHLPRTTAAASNATPQQEKTAPAVPASVTAPPAVDQSPSPATTRSTTTLTPPSNSNSLPPRGSQSSGDSSAAAPAVSTSLPASAPGNPEGNDVTTRTLHQSTPSPPLAQSAVPLKLVIRAQETSWISVQADGQNVSQETLIAPAHASIRAAREIVVRIGNAAGVTFLWNGQEIPADGAEAEVKTFVFDANGMRVITATAPPQDH
jgi:cytoskeleton protein RodZ